MFCILNPYQLLSQGNMPIDRIELGRTPERSRFHWKVDDKGEWLDWKYFSKRTLVVKKGNGNGEETITVAEYLLSVAEWLKGKLLSIKRSESMIWDPGDHERKWILPYLKVSDVEEIKKMLDDDIALLMNAVKQDK